MGIEKQFSELKATIGDGFDSLERRLDRVERRVDEVSWRLDGVLQKLDRIKK
jgi:hypothetical protein